VEKLKTAPFVVVRVEKKETKRSPRSFYDQQTPAGGLRKLSFSAKKP